MADTTDAPAEYEGMTRDQLVARLRVLEEGKARTHDAESRTLYDLEVHQVELEMQNQELRATHARLEETRERFRDLYDFAPIAYVTLREDGRITDANLTAAALFGIERGKLMGKFLAGLCDARDGRILREHISRCFEERIRVECEVTFDFPRRPAVFAHIASLPFFGPDGHVTECKSMISDITQFKRAQEKLIFLARASAVLGSSFDYRATLAQVARQAVPVLADVCIVDLADAHGGVVRRLEVACADPAKAERLARFQVGAPRADDATVLGRVIRTREPLLLSDCTPASLAATSGGFDHDILIKASGAQSIMVVPIVARDTALGAITLIASESARRYTDTSLSTARDLAAHAALAIDNARLYERAQQAIRAREDVLSFVSHDLRNPLMGIQLTTETMLRGVPAEERRKGWKQLERIRRGAQQMRHMIDDLLDMASLDAGQLTVQKGVHDAHRLFDDAAAMLAPLAAEKGVALHFDVSKNHVPGGVEGVEGVEGVIVRCDRERVIQVLSNIVGNAIKFTPAEGTVTVTARATETHGLFAVTDTGPGISPTIRPHIFERFWKGEDLTRRGRGLGLYIAKGLVEAQGGAIWVDSPVGGGSTFSFTLPLASAVEVDTFRATMEATRGSFGRGPAVERK
jgi:PAS domain S-box-containing protein